MVVAGAGLLEEIYANGGVEDARVIFLGEDAETPRGDARATGGARARTRAQESRGTAIRGPGGRRRRARDAPLDGIEALGAVASTATRVLALDNIQDPGNLGTFVRTALALGVGRRRAASGNVRPVQR